MPVLYFVPPTIMLFTVKTVYRVVVSASSREAAYATIYQQVKNEPGVILAGVEVYEEKKKRGLFKRLLFGN